MDAPVVGDRAGEHPGVLDVVADEMDGRAERPDPFDLQGVRGPGRDHGDRDLAPGAAVGQGLAEVAGAGTDRGG